MGYFTEIAGSWASSPTNFSGLWGGFAGVSCLASGTCTAVGGYDGHSVFMSGTIASMGSVNIVPDLADGTELLSVDCVDATHCTAVGGAYWRSKPVVASTTDGSSWTQSLLPGSYEPWSDSAMYLSGVSCTSAATCTAVGTLGSYYSSSGTSAVGINKKADAWGSVDTISSHGSMAGLACPDPSACTAVGWANGYGVVATEYLVTAPAAPIQGHLKVRSICITAHWSEPTSLDGPVKRYVVTVSDAQGNVLTTRATKTGTAKSLILRIEALSPGATYSVQVYAVERVGVGTPDAHNVNSQVSNTVTWSRVA
jgi:hypothetical protein